MTFGGPPRVAWSRVFYPIADGAGRQAGCQKRGCQKGACLGNPLFEHPRHTTPSVVISGLPKRADIAGTHATKRVAPPGGAQSVHAEMLEMAM